MLVFVHSVVPHKQLRQIITILLKSGVAQKVTKLNYVHSYTLNPEKKIIKTQEKMLMIYVLDSSYEKFIILMKKQWGLEIVSQL